VSGGTVAAVTLRVREAVAGDGAAVAELLTVLGYPASNEFALQRLVAFDADPASRVQVAEADGVVVGLVATHVVPRLDADLFSCRIVDLAVSVGHRRQGVGSALVAAAEAEARRSGCRRLDLSSGDWRDDAHAFYERMDSKARRAASYGDCNGLDAYGACGRVEKARRQSSSISSLTVRRHS
jgi:GNAT superfamily N-acetyltransferase